MPLICPLCHHEYKSAVYCKKEGKDICWNHCQACQWFRKLTYACLYKDGHEEARDAARRRVRQILTEKSLAGRRNAVLKIRSKQY